MASSVASLLLISFDARSTSASDTASSHWLLPRDMDTSPPPFRTRFEDHATLLFSWWATCFALAIILVRLAGRYVRTECLFPEDKIMALGIIPLIIRMGFVHVVLLYGTNNVVTTGLTAQEIQQREIGSRLVLLSRIFYSIFVWTCKLTVCSFLKRLTATIWRRSYEIGLQIIYALLFVTLFAIIVSDIAQCIPFSHYYQVVPDPGPQCRQGFAHLITMGVCDIITDVVLVIFPIPIVLRSAMTVKRKFQLICLFGLSIILIVVAGYRMPSVIERHGQQQYRTVWASCEIIAAAGVSNALILGSFLRDRGLKKQKYKWGSMTDSIDRPSIRRNRSNTIHSYASDEDLIRGMGFGAQADLERNRTLVPRPAPIASPKGEEIDLEDYRFPREDVEAPMAAVAHRAPSPTPGASTDEGRVVAQRVNAPLRRSAESPLPSPGTEVTLSSGAKNMSFFDVGGLLDSPSIHHSPTQSMATTVDMTGSASFDYATRPAPTSAANGNSHGLLGNSAHEPPSRPPIASARRGSRQLLTDLGAFLPTSTSGANSSRPQAPRGRSDSRAHPAESYEMARVKRLRQEESTTHSRSSSNGRSGSGSRSRNHSAQRPIPPTGVPQPHLDHDRGKKGELMDVGGLLND